VTTSEIVGDFQVQIDRVVAVFHDARAGFRLVLERFENIQRDAVSRSSGDPDAGSVEILDTKRIYYGKGEPWAPDSKVQLVTTQAAYKARNRVAGDNYMLVGNLCLVAIYQLWEDQYRALLAKSLGKAKNDLVSPALGDVRKFRQAIIHNHAVATEEVERAEIFRWFRRGETINLDEDRFDEVAGRVRDYLRSLTSV
jgi:hypothetical protein